MNNKQNSIKKRLKNAAFTLIEVLVVIGIIAVLAGVVLVAVNPSRQFKLARDSQRTSNVNAILNAVHQNIAEHKGQLVCEGTTKTLPSQFEEISSVSTQGGDIAKCLVPDYLSSLPFDPLTGSYTDKDNYKLGYYISRDSDGRITASSSAELAGSIWVTR